ncbi:MAG: hypothetical protein GXN92_03295, partial [Candidatus Micrarchaeota archaeon]|nr:hypothetical protein [Candidatus Micrarchaeota archaeon]
MIDIHSHFFEYKGEITTITCGYDVESSLKADFVGIAPQTVPSISWEDLEKVMELVPKAKGVGEIGMDYKWAKTPEEREKQEEVFLLQL